MSAIDTLASLWRLADSPPDTLQYANLSGADPVLPSSFAVGTAAQTSVAAAALAAVELGHVRGQPRQQVSVDMTHAALECSGWFSLNGVTPNSGFGELSAMAHSAKFSRTPTRWARPSMPPGTHPPEWPATPESLRLISPFDVMKTSQQVTASTRPSTPRLRSTKNP